jgi:hypothetical protein
MLVKDPTNLTLFAISQVPCVCIKAHATVKVCVSTKTRHSQLQLQLHSLCCLSGCCCTPLCTTSSIARALSFIARALSFIARALCAPQVQLHEHSCCMSGVAGIFIASASLFACAIHLLCVHVLCIACGP